MAAGNRSEVGKSVSAVMARIAIAGCGGSGSSASDAKTYVRTISIDASQVAPYAIRIGQDILDNNLAGLAQDARTAHDGFVDVKTDIIGAGNNVSDNDRLGTAELQLDDAINELRNAMRALVAFTENPNSGTLGVASAMLDRGIADWDQATTVLWTMAGRANEIPPLAGSAAAGAPTTQTTTPTTTTPTNAPASQSQSAPTSTTSGAATCSRDPSPGGPLEADADGILIKAKRGQYGPACQQVANHLIATDPAAAQAYCEDTGWGGPGGWQLRSKPGYDDADNRSRSPVLRIRPVPERIAQVRRAGEDSDHERPGPFALRQARSSVTQSPLM